MAAIPGLPETSGAIEFAAVLHALSDPGAVLPRRFEPHELLTHWQARAVVRYAVPILRQADRERLIADTAAEVAETAQATVLEAVAASADRIAALEQLAADMLGRFTKGDAGYRARVGQVQIRRWQDVLNGGPQ